MQEIWKDIKNYESCYQVSNLGKVRSLTRKVNTYNGVRITKGQLLKPLKTNRNYLRVCLKKNQKNKYVSIHRLVAEAFIPNPNNYPIINHIDGNTSNNKASNLEWCTQKHNIKYAYMFGKAKATKGCFKKGYIPHNRRKINQYSLDGILLNTFNSVKEAGLFVNTVPSNINNCLSGKTKKAKGFIWKYVNN